MFKCKMSQRSLYVCVTIMLLLAFISFYSSLRDYFRKSKELVKEKEGRDRDLLNFICLPENPMQGIPKLLPS